jgi:hypothetical protein
MSFQDKLKKRILRGCAHEVSQACRDTWFRFAGNLVENRRILFRFVIAQVSDTLLDLRLHFEQRYA